MAITSSQAEFQIDNFNLSPTGTSVDAFSVSFVSTEDETSTTSGSAEALFDILDNSTISETRSLSEGQGDSLLSLTTSDTEVVGSFLVEAGETFSFDFDGFFNVATSNEAISSESAIAAATISLLLIDTTIGSSPSLVGFFDLFAQLETIGDSDLLFTPLSRGGIAVDIFDTDTSFGATNSNEFINAQFAGSFNSFFEDSKSLTLLQVQNSFTAISVDEPVIPNNPPIAQSDRFSTGEDISLHFSVEDLLLNDSDPDNNFLTLESISDVANGTVEIDGEDLVFNPDPDFNGLTSFSYTIADRRGGQDTAQVDIFVKPKPDHPNIINGSTFSRVIIGTEQDDLITGGHGFQFINTNAGEDMLVYHNISDAFDIIGDFEVGEDSLDLTPLLASFDYQGSDPFVDGFIDIFSFGSYNVVSVDPDGSDGHARATVLAVVDTSSTVGTFNEDSIHF